jgi:hypothetical protein
MYKDGAAKTVTKNLDYDPSIHRRRQAAKIERR